MDNYENMVVKRESMGEKIYYDFKKVWRLVIF